MGTLNRADVELRDIHSPLQHTPTVADPAPTAATSPSAAFQRMLLSRHSSARTESDVLSLHGSLGNRTIQRKLSARADERERPRSSSMSGGLPLGLRAGIERLSGLSMDDVRVHYNSEQPREVGADAFAARSDIHVAPGAEQHLAHEAWHVVQQKQGRVPAHRRIAGAPVNTDPALEHEADRFGQRAQQLGAAGPGYEAPAATSARGPASSAPVRQLWMSRSPKSKSTEVVTSPVLEPLVESGLVEHAGTEDIRQGVDWSWLMFNVIQKRMQLYKTVADNFEVYHATTRAKATGITTKNKTLHRGRNYLSFKGSDYSSRGYLYFGLTPKVPGDFATLSSTLGDDWVMLKLRLPQGTLIQQDPEWPQGLRAPIDLPSSRCEIYTTAAEYTQDKKDRKRQQASDV
jgi:hypothetical protein